MMDKKQLMLAVLSPARGDAHTSVQIQKLFFLMDQQIAELVCGLHFTFAPYNYGPFDLAVYHELEQLEIEDLVSTVPWGTWRTYRLTNTGQELGEKALRALPDTAQKYIQNISEWVRKLSFSQLVSAIYKAYPNIRENGVFQDGNGG